MESDSDSDGDEDYSRASEALRSPSSASTPQPGDGAGGAGSGAGATGVVMPDKKACDAAFERSDRTAAGVLSLAQIEDAVSNLFPGFKHGSKRQILMRAYRAADAQKDGRIGKPEFQRLLAFFIFFSDCWQSLDAFDKSHGRKLSPADFKEGCSRVLKLSPASADLQPAFESLDTNGNGYVLFDQFCSWAASRHASDSRAAAAGGGGGGAAGSPNAGGGADVVYAG
eukprot:SAG22_NODE_1729_length_3709_cov_2.780055_4_plen_225_part_01